MNQTGFHNGTLKPIPESIRPHGLAYGTLETDEFKRQTIEFAAALGGTHHLKQLIVNQNFNHFEMMDDFANPHGQIGAAILSQMGL